MLLTARKNEGIYESLAFFRFQSISFHNKTGSLFAIKTSISIDKQLQNNPHRLRKWSKLLDLIVADHIQSSHLYCFRSLHGSQIAYEIWRFSDMLYIICLKHFELESNFPSKFDIFIATWKPKLLIFCIVQRLRWAVVFVHITVEAILLSFSNYSIFNSYCESSSYGFKQNSQAQAKHVTQCIHVPKWYKYYF